MKLFETILPEGLRWGCVGEYYSVTKKPRRLEFPEDDRIPFIPMDHISQRGNFEATYQMRSLESITSGTYVERGDVLVSKITPSFENGKQALIEDLPTPFAYATTEVIPLQTKDPGQNPRLLFYYLLHPDVRSYVAAKMEGSTGRQRVPDSAILTLPFPCIPTVEQTAIEAALTLVQSSLRIEDESILRCQQVKDTAMQSLFTAGLRNESLTETEIGLIPESWKLDVLASVCKMRSGGTPPKSDLTLWRGTFPWVSGKDLKVNRLSDSTDHITEDAAQQFSEIAPAGSILVLVRGMGLAKGFPLSLIERPMAFNQDLKALIPNDKADGAYLMHLLTYASMRMLRTVSDAAHGTKRLGQSELDRFVLPLPSRKEQSEIAAILDSIDQKIVLHRKKKALLEQLFLTLLHKLFSGELRAKDLDLAAISNVEMVGAKR